MSTVAQFVALVESVFDKRFYPDVAPENSKLPYATWSQVGGIPLTYLEGANADKQAARIQINVWAKNVMDARQKMIAVADIVVTTPINGEPQSAARSAYSQPSPNVRGMQQDFMIWFQQ